MDCRGEREQEERGQEQGPSPTGDTSLLMMNCMGFRVSFLHTVLPSIVLDPGARGWGTGVGGGSGLHVHFSPPAFWDTTIIFMC